MMRPRNEAHFYPSAPILPRPDLNQAKSFHVMPFLLIHHVFHYPFLSRSPARIRKLGGSHTAFAQRTAHTITSRRKIVSIHNGT